MGTDGMKRRRGFWGAFLLLFFTLIHPAYGAISNVSIDTGTGGSLTTVTISPDDDGTDDRAFIHFTSDVDGAFRVIVDTNGTSGFQPPDWSDPTSWDTADTTMEGWASANSSNEFVFEGRDNQWRTLSNGTYNVEIVVDVDGDWNTTNDQTTDTSLTVTLQTASISGTVTSGGSPLAGVRVNAGSQYGWGEAKTASDGTYTISGLKAGSYHVDAQKDGYVNAQYSQNVTVTAGQNTSGIDLTMDPSVQITGSITIPAAFQSYTNQWGGMEEQLHVNINGWSDNGSGWTWAEAHFHDPNGPFCQNAQSGQDMDGDGTQDVDECANPTTTTYSLDIQPPASGQTQTYHIRAEADGYASAEYTLTVDASGGSKDFSMSKASRIYGTVTLPSANSTGAPLWIDVNAKTTDGTMVWGGGSVDVGQTQGTFDIRSALAGTYTVEVRTMGYKTTSIPNVTVTAGQDTDLGNLTLTQGGKITGTITISGDTTNYKASEGDDGTQPITLWVDAWSPGNDGWSGTQVQIQRGVDQSATYTIAGLAAGTYEIHSWLGEGYDQDPMPLTATLSSDSDTASGADMTFAPYAGKITGTISGSGVDMSKVVIKATKSGWEWQEPIMTQPASDGTYTLSGLGTSEYILEVNEYSNAANMMSNQQPGQPTGNFGSEILRVPVMNGKTSSGKDITLKTGGSISGKVCKESGYAGDVNFATDLAGKMVVAVPMKMAMMGGNSTFMGPLQNYDAATGCYTYTISGLGAGAYNVSPPTDGLINDPNKAIDPSAQMHEQMFLPDIAADDQVVSVSAGENKTGVDFTLSDGYSVSGTLTLPEAPSGNDWDYICDLELRHPHKEGMGRRIPVFLRNFRTDPSDPNSTITKTYSFTLKHVMEGNYVLQAWTPNYVPAYKNVTVSGGDVVGAALELKKGASITGKLVDADTGEVITPDDGVRVHCEAVPWVEGSWRETFQDPWSNSRFLDENGKYTGGFRLANLPAGTYVVTVEASHGMKRNGAKNYIGIKKAGVVVPETSGASVDIGTLELREGVTITGKVTADGTGSPIGNIDVVAEPADEHDGTASSFGKTDANGNYTIYGVDPDVKYYMVTAGARPDFMEFVPVSWGEVEKDVTVTSTGLTGLDFSLPAASATFSGTIHKTGSSPWKVPFEDDMPAPYLLLQRQGEVYSDPMGGIDFMGDPSDGDTTTFHVDGIVPGTYNLKIFCLGYTTKIIRGIQITDGDNTYPNTIEMVEGGTVSGSMIKEDGTYPTLAEVSQAVAVSADMDVLIFGTVTSNAASQEVSAYSISGLEAGKTYNLVFVNDGDNGPGDIRVMPDPVQAGDTYNAVIGDTTPVITARAKKESDGSFTIGIFSTSYLNDASASDILSLTTGNGTLSGTLEPDKREINATYTPASGESTFTITLTAHYGTNNTVVSKAFTYDVNATAWNEGKVNTLMGGEVALGQGDKSKVFFEPGAITDASGDGVSTITFEKDDSALSGNGVRSNSVRGESLLAEATPALPSYATAASALYDVTLQSGDAITSGSSITVSLQYDSSVTDTSDLHIYHYTGGAWVAEDTNKNIDTVNHTISADVTSLSPFEVATGSSSGSSGSSTSTSSSGGGGCALTASPVSMWDGLTGVMILLLPLIVLGTLRLRRYQDRD